MTDETVYETAKDGNELAEDLSPPGAFSTMLPKMMNVVPPLMIMRLLVLLTGLGLGIWTADLVGTAIGEGVQGAGAGDFETAQVMGAWLPSFEFLGMGLILFSISVTLLGIATGLRTMLANTTQLILEHEEPER
jgi:hypothetical protein